MNPTALTIAIAYGGVVVLALVAILWIWRSTHSFESPRTDTTDTDGARAPREGLVHLRGDRPRRAAAGDPRLHPLRRQRRGEGPAGRGRGAASSSPGPSRPTRSRRACRCASRSRPGRREPRLRRLQQRQRAAVPDPGGARTATSHIVYTFKVPGRYQVVCLEFCGLDHHKMIGSFQVRAVSDDARREPWDYTPVSDPAARAVAKSLTLWYVLASTAIFLVAGLLGAALRQSQADIVPARRQHLLRGHDRPRPRGLRGLGRLRRDGLRLVGARRGGLPDRPPRRARWRGRSGG